MVTHQIPQHCLATAWCRRRRRALGLGRVGRRGLVNWHAHPHIHLSQLQLSVYCQAYVRETRLGIFFFLFLLVRGSWGRAVWQWDRSSVHMQPLCCSQCVVQWCSQTPKHVLLKLYECTYCLLFYNHCTTSSWMSHGSIVDVNIYLTASYAFFFF